MEVVGVALAIFPLLGSTIDGVNVVKSAVCLRTDYKKCRARLRREQTMFESNLERFLQPLVCDDQRVADLISHPNDEAWRELELNEMIRRRLGRCYDSYLETVTSLGQDLYDLAKTLGTDDSVIQARLGPTHASAFTTLKSRSRWLSWIKVEVYRIKFVLGANGRDKLIESVAEQNTKLLQFMNNQDAIAPFSTTRTPGPRKYKAKSPLMRCWHHASNIYGLMQKLWCCNCKGSHNAELLLRHHEPCPTVVDYRVYFRFTKEVDDVPNAPWDFAAAAIFPGDDASAQASRARPPSPLTSVSKFAFEEASQAMKRRGKPAGKRGVLFALPTASVMGFSPIANESVGNEITDLCSTISYAFQERKCLGVVGQSPNRYFIQPLDYQDPPKRELEYIPLSEVLRKPQKLTRIQSFSVALAIASSFLQLRHSPWLEPQWGKNTIYMVYDRRTRTFYDEPRMSRAFSAENTTFVPGPMDLGMAKLSVMLMELCYGLSIEEHREQRFSDASYVDTDLSDLRVASDLNKKLSIIYMQADYATAISYCLENSNTNQPVNLDDQEWRGKFLKEVVEPLAETNQHVLRSMDMRESNAPRLFL